LSRFISDSLISIVLIFVAGLMISLSINELLKEALKYKEDKYIIYGLLSGVAIIIVNHLL